MKVKGIDQQVLNPADVCPHTRTRPRSCTLASFGVLAGVLASPRPGFQGQTAAGGGRASAGGRRRGSALRAPVVSRRLPLSSGQVGHHGLLQGTDSTASAHPQPHGMRPACSPSLPGGPRGAVWLATYRKEPLCPPALPVGVPLRQRAAVRRVAVKGVVGTCDKRRGEAGSRAL